MIKRLGIFIFYDAMGIADKYVFEILRGLQKYVGEFIIVINGEIRSEYMPLFEQYSDSVYLRENRGYDGGAYKDVFLYYLKKKDLSEWDEILLFNDTFYAPIFSWNPVFERMSYEDCDFWGLTRHVGGGTVLGCDKKIQNHIQGYFFVCRKKMLISSFFYEFWEKLLYPETYEDAIFDFEINFSVFFSQRGFKGIAYTDVHNELINVEYGENVYLKKAYELLCKLKLPIVKRRVFSLENFDQMEKVLSYISENSEYDSNLIDEHLKRMCEEGRIPSFNPLQLQNFYETHKKIYIYGHGQYGVNIAKYFTYRKWNYEGFLVSKIHNNEGEDNVQEYANVEISSSDGIILALGKKSLDEVLSEVRKKVGEEQLCIPKM